MAKGLAGVGRENCPRTDLIQIRLGQKEQFGAAVDDPIQKLIINVKRDSRYGQVQELTNTENIGFYLLFNPHNIVTWPVSVQGPMCHIWKFVYGTGMEVAQRSHYVFLGGRGEVRGLGYYIARKV